MKNLIEYAVQRPVAVIMALFALFIAGVFSASTLPLQRLPDFSYPRVTVETNYPGMGAEDIRSIVTIPVEDALSSVRGLRRMQSISRDGSSLVVMDFDWGTESGAVSVLVREAIDAVYPDLPEGVEKPAVIPGGSGEDPQIIVAVESNLGNAFARNLAEYEIKPRLRRIEGTGNVITSGGEKEGLEIKTDLPRLASRGLFPSTLADILISETSNIPAGNAKEGDRELAIISSGRPESKEELVRSVFPSQRGAFSLGDAGTIKTAAEKKESLFIRAGKNGAAEQTALEIYRRPGADPVRLSREVRKAVDEAAALFGRDAGISVVWDDAPSITDGIIKLAVSALLGAAAVMTVLFWTLRSLNCSILAGLSIPLSAAASLAALALCGRSLNGMSISGIALGIGLVSDTAVIILDLLHGNFPAGKNRPQAKEVSRAAASVAASSLGGTLTTAVVFVPVLFLPGPLGALFGDLSISLVVSVTAGWVYAQFALPSLYRMFYGKSGKKRKNKVIPEFFFSACETFSKKPLFAVLAAVLLSAAGLSLLFARPAVFISPDEVQEIEVTVNFPPGTTLESMTEPAAGIIQKIAALPAFDAAFGRAGAEKEDSARRADPLYRKESFHIRCPVRSGYKSKAALFEIKKALNQGENDEKQFREFPKTETEILVSFPPDKTEKLLGLSSAAVFVLKGKDPTEVKERINVIEKEIFDSGFAAELSARPSGLRPELRILPKREASAFLGVSMLEAAKAVFAASEGIIAGELENEGRPLEIKVSGDLEGKPFPETLESLPVALTENGPVFLGSIAAMERREAPSALLRLDRSDAVFIEAAAKNGGKNKLRTFLNSLNEKSGNTGAGNFAPADESVFIRYKSSLVLTAALALFLLYLTIGALFESFSLPLILMLTIPFSLAGAGPALFLRGAGLDSSSVMGLLVLFGISVNSGMVLFERAGEKISSGAALEGAVYGAARDRFYPLFATTLTTACALVPLAVSPLGQGQRSMAAAMLGGICASTALTHFILPSTFIAYLKKTPGKEKL